MLLKLFLLCTSVHVGSDFIRSLFPAYQSIPAEKVRSLNVRCSNLELGVRSSRTGEYSNELMLKRREAIGLVLGVSGVFIDSLDAKAAGLPPEDKPRLCDDSCEKELENVW